ncbi:MAG: porphobilinogen synthase [Firmicutes bacterium]|nr:porphobilinogen synthase [Alicyclobacillaceae bacterium]MCL6497599.1 porphobilinogen synthase [Bacillota bacterium]
MFPIERPRRLRQNPTLRAMVQETRLAVDELIYPLFVRPGQGVQQPIAAMPGIFQWSVDRALEHAAIVRETGVNCFLFFGIPAHKDAIGSGAWDPEGVVPQALRAFRRHFPDAVLIADLCLCEYTDHGHCGVVDAQGRILNDPTLDLLARAAVVLAEAGADVIAPSDMMDGRVARIRQALDEAGLQTVPILSYAAKFASAFYGPFREAAENAPAFGDRRTYQMDPANRREAIKEVLLDIAEGADLVMVKPALPYLDVLREVRERVLVPVVAYQVSGEFAMIKGAAQHGWIDERRAVEETLTAIRRAGADLIITYYAPEVGRWLQQG